MLLYLKLVKGISQSKIFFEIHVCAVLCEFCEHGNSQNYLFFFPWKVYASTVLQNYRYYFFHELVTYNWPL